MATLYTQQDKNWRNKFFSSKTNRILLVVLVFLMVFVVKFMLSRSGTHLPWSKNISTPEIYSEAVDKNDEWITTDFSTACGGPCEGYVVNISYPKEYTFGCCGDTEAGTFHTLQIPNTEATGVQILEGAYYCSDPLDENCTVEPQYYFADKIQNGEVTRIDDVETDHLGFSIFAIKGYTDEWATNTPYEKYIFIIPTNSNKPYSFKYYQVGFFHPEKMTDEFKTEFLNRLEIWTPISTEVSAYLTGFEKREDGFWYLTLDNIRTEGGSDAGLPRPSGWKITNLNRSTETFKASADIRVQVDSEQCQYSSGNLPERFELFSDYVNRLQKKDFYYWNPDSDAKYGWQLPGYYWITITNGVATKMTETYNNCGA